MERAARVVNASKSAKKILTDDELVRAVWPSAVGKVITEHTSRLRVVRSTLVVEVADPVWQKQLFRLSGQILERLEKTLGDRRITQIEFRVGIPRREPQRENVTGGSLPSAASGDEADQINDPVLKRIYQLSRKKASA